MSQPKLRIAKLTEIQPDPMNANLHTERGRNMVERSLRERGFFRPMAAAGKGVSQPVMLAGNLTQETAASIGMDEAIIVETDGTRPIVHVRTDVEPGTPEAILLGLEDNRAAEVSLNFSPQILQEYSTKLDLTPLWSKDELSAKLAEIPMNGRDEVEDPEPQIDRAEELRKQWGVETGQVWQLDRHIIACVDCLQKEEAQKIIGERIPDMVWADPPYGISIVAANAAKPFGTVGTISRGMKAKPIMEAGKYAPVIGDETTETAEKSSALYLSLFPQATHFWWGANYYANALPPSSCWVVWDKENGESFFADCELAWTNNQTAVRIFHHMWNGLMKASEKGQRRVHPTQKPVALAKWAFEKYGEDSDVILDPFLGSGMSLIAAEQSGSRSIIGFELSPDYIAVVLDRWKTLTGKEPKLL